MDNKEYITDPLIELLAIALYQNREMAMDHHWQNESIETRNHYRYIAKGKSLLEDTQVYLPEPIYNFIPGI